MGLKFIKSMKLKLIKSPKDCVFALTRDDYWDNRGDGYGYGYGYSYSYGDGYGYGYGYGYGDGYSYGDGYGYGYGCGYGYGYGNGSGKSNKLLAAEFEHNTDRLVEWYLSEENVEIRTRIIQKIGLEPILSKVKARLIEKKTMKVGGIYELYACKMFGEERRFLKMINPSTGIYHLEWVPPDVNSVVDALKWRNNGYLPDKIT